MSMHKLSAGSGYDYLTRQVAAFDGTDKGRAGLASYYTERGESPGVWVGSGLTDIDGIASGDRVTATQMQSLFGAGMHPVEGYLGQPFRLHVSEDSDYRTAITTAVGDRNDSAGLPRASPVSDAVRAEVRTRVAVSTFTAQHGRPPVGVVELSDWVATHTRVASTAVAGFDLTFSPVKSVSTLWAIADPRMSALVERAHQAAVRDALAFIEDHALFSRTGRGGIRQVDVAGLVATAFTHRDSRAGDPDLHTHVAVANKVLTQPGNGAAGSERKWLSIDGRALFKAATAASEAYNAALERHLVDLLGVEFADRDPAVREAGAKRGVREVVGINPGLNARWSQRRAQIADRQTTLAAQFRVDHGRPPTPVEAIHLAQQANLETRDAKHTARTLAEQRATWHTEAVEVLGSPRALDRMLHHVTHPARIPTPEALSPSLIDAVAMRVVGEIEQRRATWQLAHVHAETHRQLRAIPLTTDDAERAFDAVTRSVLEVHSVSLAAPTDAELGIVEPAALRRADGTSVYEVHGRTRYSSARILAAEARLLAHAGSYGAPTVPETHVQLALAEAAAHGTPLNQGQSALVRDMASSQKRLQVAIAPAGTGKTTALRALASAWTDAGGTVLALAPSAAAAAVLGEAIGPGQKGGTHAGTHAGTPKPAGPVADTLSKLTHALDHLEQPAPHWVTSLGPATLVLIDEAAMADTLTLERAVTHAIDHGATIRLLGDDQQLSAVGAGGILRDLAHHHGALRLDDVMRFTDPDEATATTRLRLGVRLDEALGFYLDHDRVHVADHHTALTDLHAAWQQDRSRGLETLMVAPTRDAVRDLNHLAQTALRAAAGEEPAGHGVPLADGLRGGVGDLVVTRTNNRRLAYTAIDWVKNGDRWTITTTHPDGTLGVRNHRNGLTTTLPADYVAASVELGYATTIHSAQGSTVDTLHGLLTGRETRQDLYTMLTRGRHANHLYLPTDATTGDPHDLATPRATHPETAYEKLLDIALRDGAAASATIELQNARDPDTRHAQAVARFEDALTHACEEILGPEAGADVETTARELLPGIDTHSAWPTLRQTLLLAAAAGRPPGEVIGQALARGPLSGASDPAAALDWRITELNALSGTARRVKIPQRVADAPTWGPYLSSRRDLVDELGRGNERTPRPVQVQHPSREGQAGSVADRVPPR